MKPSLNKALYRTISNELRVGSLVFYILAIGIGMLFNYTKYNNFDINIFQYSDVLDFLIIPFSDLLILLFTIMSILIVYGIYQLDAWWQKRFPGLYSKFNFRLDSKPWFDAYRQISFLLIFLLYLVIAANVYGKVVRNQIEESSPIALQFTDNENITGRYIGKTKDVLFFIDHQNNVKATPLVNLKMYGTQPISKRSTFLQ